MTRQVVRNVTIIACAAIALTTMRCNQTPAPGSGGTGTLKLLVTDKPYPFDLIAEATITITRVEVRRSGNDGCVEECDDGVFCNGSEECSSGECQPGTAP